MDNEAILDQLVVSITMPQCVGAGTGILAPPDGDPSSEHPPEEINTPQRAQDTPLLDV